MIALASLAMAFSFFSGARKTPCTKSIVRPRCSPTWTGVWCPLVAWISRPSSSSRVQVRTLESHAAASESLKRAKSSTKGSSRAPTRGVRRRNQRRVALVEISEGGLGGGPRQASGSRRCLVKTSVNFWKMKGLRDQPWGMAAK